MSMLSWLKTQLALFLLAILVKGPIPRHIALEMDGNRRYARKNGKRVEEGHRQGYVSLDRAMKLCAFLQIRSVTVYAFSIENFNRPPDEVDAIMKLIEEKLREISQPGAALDEWGTRLRVLGKRELLPPAVQAAAEEAENRSCHNNKTILNFCMPYTSQHEITTAVRSVVHNALRDGDTHGFKITEQTIDDHLMTSLVGSPPLDVFVRTSGVKKLSRFLQWQCCEDTQIHMIDPCWPEFGLLDFLPILLDYQRKVWATASKK